MFANASSEVGVSSPVGDIAVDPFGVSFSTYPGVSNEYFTLSAGVTIRVIPNRPPPPPPVPAVVDLPLDIQETVWITEGYNPVPSIWDDHRWDIRWDTQICWHTAGAIAVAGTVAVLSFLSGAWLLPKNTVFPFMPGFYDDNDWSISM